MVATFGLDLQAQFHLLEGSIGSLVGGDGYGCRLHAVVDEEHARGVEGACCIEEGKLVYSRRQLVCSDGLRVCGVAHRERINQFAPALARQRVAQQMCGIGLWGGEGYLQRLVVGCEAQGIALLLGLGQGEDIFLALIAGLHLGTVLGGRVEEAAHAAVLGRECDDVTVGIGKRFYRHALSLLVGGLEGDAVLYAHDEVSAFGEEVDVERLCRGCLGTIYAHALVGIHLRIAVVALLLGRLVYGKHAGEAAVRIEVEHGAGIGPHLIVSAGVAQHAAFVVGLLHRGVYQGERAVAAAVHHL